MATRVNRKYRNKILVCFELFDMDKKAISQHFCVLEEKLLSILIWPSHFTFVSFESVMLSWRDCGLHMQAFALERYEFQCWIQQVSSVWLGAGYLFSLCIHFLCCKSLKVLWGLEKKARDLVIKKKSSRTFYNTILILPFPIANEEFCLSMCANHSGFHLFPLL